jgi:cyclic pyranopterin phosphate synthase
MGVRRVRLTGGEPTFRKDLLDIAREIRSLAGIEEICMTTNGHLLAELAEPLLAAGVSRLNISLDTLDEAKFRTITKNGELRRVLDGIDACLRAGYPSLKLNTVVIRGMNEDDVGPLIHYSWARGIVPRFIECMPFATGKPVPTAELLGRLEKEGLPLAPERDVACPTRGPQAGPSEYFLGEGGRVGFIGPLTRNFCGQCNRVRIAANGDLRACLGGRERVPLGTIVRDGGSDRDLAQAIRSALGRKPDGHRMTDPDARSQLLSRMGSGG